jgi:hypothetical protein
MTPPQPRRQSRWRHDVDRLLRHATRVPEFRSLWRRHPAGSVALRTRFGIWSRPQYAYGVLAAAQQSVALGKKAISVVELGVAGGNGLLALEAISAEIGAELDIEISVWGFDSGTGMPPPRDYRDLPHVWDAGFYEMDVDSLTARLTPSTRLVLGDVAETIPMSLCEMDPLGFIAFDLDYYSSTRDAFAIFDGDTTTRLPRVFCYFDDTIFPEWACHNEALGELLAIKEFNESNSDMALYPIHMLRWIRARAELWNEQIYVMHDFTHPDYTRNLSRLRGETMQYDLR